MACAGKKIRMGIYVCPSCGRDVEIFSDEKKAKCPGCEKVIIKANLSACVEWCSGARECLGEARKKKKKG
jgi:DNA-directed RNA polymerase subunit RPC12/RpoP